MGSSEYHVLLRQERFPAETPQTMPEEGEPTGRLHLQTPGTGGSRILQGVAEIYRGSLCLRAGTLLRATTNSPQQAKRYPAAHTLAIYTGGEGGVERGHPQHPHQLRQFPQRPDQGHHGSEETIPGTNQHETATSSAR